MKFSFKFKIQSMKLTKKLGVSYSSLFVSHSLVGLSFEPVIKILFNITIDVLYQNELFRIPIKARNLEVLINFKAITYS